MKEIKGYTPKGKEKVMEFFNTSGDKLRALKMMFDENRPNLSLSDCKHIFQVWTMELNQDNSKNLYEENIKLRQALSKMCEWHERQATWDKGDNGYYEGKGALNQTEQNAPVQSGK